MPNDSLLNIIFLLVAAAVGYAVGLLDRRVTAGVKKKKQEKEEILADEKAAVKLAAEQAKAEQVKAEQAKAEQAKQEKILESNEQTALRVLFDPSMKCFVEVDGQRVSSDGLTPEQRQRLVQVIVQIRPWIDGKAPAPATPSPSPLPQPAPIRTAAPQAAASISQTAPRIDPLRGFRSLLENEVKKKEPIHLISIVAMIDEILQRKLESSPLASKKIKLEEGSMGEVLVHVGANRYSGIDSVPDPEIQALIKDAIAEFNSGR
ncbi:MAG: hypothetical protein L6461_12240 [Anaerolineae bacterium]|nr:hypothetical protein [Anaerolineae bacterium]